MADVQAVCTKHDVDFLPEWGSGKLIFELYDTIILPTVVNPVFICGFPVEVSPLARRTADDPTLVDRFELAIDAKEFANGYSELNIPEEQQERFRGEADAAARGDLEAHPADLAFVRALEYGLPPTSGIGIGVDRLIMLLAEVEAIRDVILFPMMRPEAARDEVTVSEVPRAGSLRRPELRLRRPQFDKRPEVPGRVAAQSTQ